ncbi:MAG: DUF1289 domain-containing protein [Pseudomonadota bacterium]
MREKIPSPCVKVCKFKRQGHCIGCGLTKDQKRAFKSIRKPKKRLNFIRKLIRQQDKLGGYPMWPRAWRKRCAKKDVTCPLDVPGLLET